MDVRVLLSEPGRRWNGRAGVPQSALDRLATASSVPLPELFVDLLRFSNGGEGALALAPLMFVLHDVDTIVETLGDQRTREYFSGFLFFGGNGLERIALDLRTASDAWPIVMIDPIAGPGSAEVIASDITQFLEAVGLEKAE